MRPNVDEFLQLELLDWQRKVICLAQKGIDNDGDEQIDEDLNDHEIKHDEEHVRDNW